MDLISDYQNYLLNPAEVDEIIVTGSITPTTKGRTKPITIVQEKFSLLMDEFQKEYVELYKDQEQPSEFDEEIRMINYDLDLLNTIILKHDLTNTHVITIKKCLEDVLKQSLALLMKLNSLCK
jgi:hypothetical protein